MPPQFLGLNSWAIDGYFMDIRRISLLKILDSTNRWDSREDFSIEETNFSVINLCYRQDFLQVWLRILGH